LSGVGIFLVAGGDTSHGLKWRSLSGVEGQAQSKIPDLSILPPLKMRGDGCPQQPQQTNTIGVACLITLANDFLLID